MACSTPRIAFSSSDATSQPITMMMANPITLGIAAKNIAMAPASEAIMASLQVLNVVAGMGGSSKVNYKVASGGKNFVSAI